MISRSILNYAAPVATPKPRRSPWHHGQDGVTDLTTTGIDFLKPSHIPGGNTPHDDKHLFECTSITPQA